jgi:hypothetical protein
MSKPTVCKRCQTYLLDHYDAILHRDGWKRCPSCNWCCDREGNNLVTKKEEKCSGKEKKSEDSDV